MNEIYLTYLDNLEQPEAPQDESSLVINEPAEDYLDVNEPSNDATEHIPFVDETMEQMDEDIVPDEDNLDFQEPDYYNSQSAEAYVEPPNLVHEENTDSNYEPYDPLPNNPLDPQNEEEYDPQEGDEESMEGEDGYDEAAEDDDEIDAHSQLDDEGEDYNDDNAGPDDDDDDDIICLND